MSNINELKEKIEELKLQKQKLMELKDTKDYQEAAAVNEYIKEGEVIGNPIWEKWYEESGFKYGLDARDHDFDVKVPKMLGEKVYYKTSEGALYKTVIDLAKDGRRIVTADIRSWVGVSPGAIHFYSNLKMSGGWFTPALEKTNCCTSFGGLKVPEYTKGIKVEITKKLTKEEMERWPERWDTYYEGDNVNAFEVEEELIEKIKTEFERIFGSKDFVLKIND